MSGTKHDEVAKQRAEIFKTIYGVKRGLFSEVLDLFEEDYKKHRNRGINKILELYRDYSYAIFFMYSPSSIRNNLVKFKNIIKKHGGKYQANALEAFTIDNIYTPLKKKDEEVKKELKGKVKSGNSTDIDPNRVIDQINRIKGILENKSYTVAPNQEEKQVRAYLIFAMLALATGRRFTEILKTFDIKKKGTKITFSGLLKGNSKTIDGNIIGLDYKGIKKYLKELRDYVKTENMTESEVNKKYARVFNNAIERFVKQGLIDDFENEEDKYKEKYITTGKNKGETKKIRTYPSPKTLRHRYSIVGSKLFKKDNESIEDTITRILGHKEVFTSALNYT